MLDEEISKYVDTLQGGAQARTLSPSLFKKYNKPLILYLLLSPVIIAVEAERQGSHGGKRCGVGIDIYLRMTSWGYQKHPKDCRNK